MMEFFFEVIVNACEKSFFAYFLSKYAKPVSKRRMIIGIFLMFIFETFINSLSLNSNYQLLIFYLADTLFVFLCFQATILRKLLLGCAEIVVASIANALTFYIADNFTSLDITQAVLPSDTRIIMISMYALICAFLFFLISRRRQQTYKLPYIFTAALLALLLIGVLAIDQTLDVSVTMVPIADTNPIFSSSFIAICILFILLSMIFLFEFIAITLNKNATLELENQQYKSEQQQIEDIHTSIKTLRSLKHDYQQHLDTITGLLMSHDYASVEKYIAELDMSSYELITATGDSIVDSLLSTKIMQAKAQHIKVSYEFFLPDKLTISATDLSIVLGNIMDNAIEACNKLPLEANPYILIDIRPARSMLYIKIINSSDGFYSVKNNVYHTTKPRGNHGIGLRRCRELIEKYNGFCTFEGTEDQFTSSIMIPIS